MKQSLVILLAFSLAIAVGAVSFWHGSRSPIRSSGSLQPVDAAGSPALSQTQHSASVEPAFAQASDAPDHNEASPSALGTSLHKPPLTGRLTTVAGAGPAAASAPSARDGAVGDAVPSSGNKASAAARSPSALSSQRKPAPLGVAVPLAFQDVDLFINTPQGLQYAPVDFNPGSGTGGASTAGAEVPTPGSPGTMVVDESSAAALEKMREDFVNQVGGLEQDPSDPQYLSRWRNAQFLSDAWFRVRFGTQAFNSYQLAAAQKAEAEKQAAARR